MKQLLFFSFTCLLFLSACNSHNGTPAVIASDSIKLADTSKATAVKRDTLKINEPAIIFTNPSDEEINAMIAKDSDAFYTAADDNAFYNSQLMELADSLAIKTMDTNNPVLDFKMNSNKHFIIDLSKSKERGFPNYLFNGIDTPQIVDIDPEKNFLKKYFNK